MNKQIELITPNQSRASVPTRKRTPASTRADWLVPAALIALTAIPSLAGTVRLAGLAEGTGLLTPDDAHFYAMPLPVVLHILGALPFCILGAFQFARKFLNSKKLKNLHPKTMK